MEAVISGQAGVALLVDGDALSSIHVHDPKTVVARRAGEFHYLFGAASDLVFIEDISPDDVRQELQAAADGEDVTQLTLLLLALDRSEEIRQLAAEELSELLAANPQAAAFAERLLLSTALPQEADLAGAMRLCSDDRARDFLVRLECLQPFVRITQEAWNAIPEDFFEDSAEDCRAAADAIVVREGVVRQFALAAAGESDLEDAVVSALQVPAFRSLTNHWNIVIRWIGYLTLGMEEISFEVADSITLRLLSRVKAGDPKAWSRLCTFYTPFVCTWAKRSGLQPVDADDVVQEVLLAAGRSLDHFFEQPSDSFQGWLYGIIHREILDHFRRLARQPNAAGGTDAQRRFESLTAPTPPDKTEPTEFGLDPRTIRAVALMQTDFEALTWKAFWMSEVLQRPGEEIAAELGISKPAVYVARSKVLRRLREALDGLDVME